MYIYKLLGISSIHDPVAEAYTTEQCIFYGRRVVQNSENELFRNGQAH